MENIIEIRNVHCAYDKSSEDPKVILEIDELHIPKGKHVFIVGESGIGKSTILEVLGVMNNTIIDRDGSRFIFKSPDGKEYDIIDMWRRGDDDELSEFRLKNFNFIFQNTNLMRNFTAYENVAMTRMLQGHSRKDSFEKTRRVLEDLGLGHIDETRMAHELSGGQQQRLAFARAILPDFTILFGDEPTGNLDNDNAVKAMELLSAKMSEHSDSSSIIVSHDMHLATTFADMIVLIRKHTREKKDSHGETAFFGCIDASSVFAPDTERKSWSNGEENYDTQTFESYLKKGGRI